MKTIKDLCELAVVCAALFVVFAYCGRQAIDESREMTDNAIDV